MKNSSLSKDEVWDIVNKYTFSFVRNQTLNKNDFVWTHIGDIVVNQVDDSVRHLPQKLGLTSMRAINTHIIQFLYFYEFN